MAVDPRKTLPTKINLIKLRKEYKVIKKIRGVLEEKRNALILYIRTLIDEYEKNYRKASQEFMEAYSEYGKVMLEMGYDKFRSIAETRKPLREATIRERVVFAVRVPVVSLGGPEEKAFSSIDLPPLLMSALEKLDKAFRDYARLIEIESSIRRMIRELKNTQRLINSIDNVILPSYERTIKHIKLVLEERMREDFMRLKVLKKKRG